MTPILELVGITKKFGDFVALKNVDLAVERGSVTCIVGPSGSGKSTLLRTINMLEEIDNGAIFFEGEMIAHSIRDGYRVPVHPRVARQQALNFGMVFQSFNLFPNLTAIENVSLAPRTVKRTDGKTARTEALELLEHVGLLEKKDQYPNELSGGQQQRVAIARALAMEPSVLLFDEPTSALDPELVGEVLAVMKSLADRGSTMLIVTHEMAFARDVADEIAMMDDGEIIARGTPTEVINQSDHVRVKNFFSSVSAAH